MNVEAFNVVLQGVSLFFENIFQKILTAFNGYFGIVLMFFVISLLARFVIVPLIGSASFSSSDYVKKKGNNS